jgi:hypothetical protein
MIQMPLGIFVEIGTMGEGLEEKIFIFKLSSSLFFQLRDIILHKNAK